MLRNLRIGTRLAVGFGGLIATTVAAFTAAVLFGLQGQADTAESERLAHERTRVVIGMRLNQLTAVTKIQSAGLRSDSAEANRDIEAYRSAMKAVVAGEADFARGELDRDERTTLDRIAVLREQAAAIATEAVNFAATFASDEVARTLSDRYAPVQEQWGAELNRLARLQDLRATAGAKAIAAHGRETSLFLAGLLCAATLTAIVFAIAMTRSVTRPLKVAGNLAARVAGGDLSIGIEVSGKDEVALLQGSLQTMTRQLAAMVQLVRESAASIGSASEAIDSGSQDLSVRTKRQASSLKETSLTVATLGSAATRNSQNADAVRQLADRTAGLAVQGGVAMAQVVETMSGISASSKRIVEIIAVIDRIAFLTNILALNAAVEAARAGEHGRGFAVVASEVRALAQRVSEASKEVRGLIGESTERVDSGAQLVGDLGTTMQELVVGVDRLRGLVGDISLASALQGEGVIQVTGSITVIEDGTQANAVMVEQMAASASSMNAETRRLSAILARFTLGDEVVPKPA